MNSRNMGFLKRHIRLVAIIAFTFLAPAVLLALMLGDVKVVAIGMAVIFVS